MTSVGSGYDLSASQFSPEGRLFQVEYAFKAVAKGDLALGLLGSDGIVLAADRHVLSKLHETELDEKIACADEHLGVVATGLRTDSRQLVEVCRGEAEQYRNEYKAPIPINVCAQRMALYMHAYCLYSAVRPFGAAVILGGYTAGGKHKPGEFKLYTIDCSGEITPHKGVATGKHSNAVHVAMEKLGSFQEKSIGELVKDAAVLVVTAQHSDIGSVPTPAKASGHQGWVKERRVELSWIGNRTNFKHEFVPDVIFEEAVQLAKKRVAEEDLDLDEEEGLGKKKGGQTSSLRAGQDDDFGQLFEDAELMHE
ncbi:unnamed protein product [Cyprideis torosa]|uniref:Proteasome alpha-type subunits domain-containing protein n=1 Tax=Cyprideis torosa TaxID=163714 RepID=A0A7R8ZTY8_9CRUS|nr:unnamed protein product [Cyprideis torosa]CAG0899243.1 unnamed protein product [Cyprideis torosa]